MALQLREFETAQQLIVSPEGDPGSLDRTRPAAIFSEAFSQFLSKPGTLSLLVQDVDSITASKGGSYALTPDPRTETHQPTRFVSILRPDMESEETSFILPDQLLEHLTPGSDTYNAPLPDNLIRHLGYLHHAFTSELFDFAAAAQVDEGIPRNIAVPGTWSTLALHGILLQDAHIGYAQAEAYSDRETMYGQRLVSLQDMSGTLEAAAKVVLQPTEPSPRQDLITLPYQARQITLPDVVRELVAHARHTGVLARQAFLTALETNAGMAKLIEQHGKDMEQIKRYFRTSAGETALLREMILSEREARLRAEEERARIEAQFGTLQAGRENRQPPPADYLAYIKSLKSPQFHLRTALKILESNLDTQTAARLVYPSAHQPVINTLRRIPLAKLFDIPTDKRELHKFLKKHGGGEMWLGSRLANRFANVDVADDELTYVLNIVSRLKEHADGFFPDVDLGRDEREARQRAQSAIRVLCRVFNTGESGVPLVHINRVAALFDLYYAALYKEDENM